MSCVHAIAYCSAMKRNTVLNTDTCYNGNELQKHFTKSRVSKFFSLKSQIVNTLWFVGHRASVATTQLHYCSVKATIDNMEWTWLCSNKFYLQKHVAC